MHPATGLKDEKRMGTDLQQTLLQLFQQVCDNPDSMPVISVDAWQQDSVEWQLLSGFQAVLERLQQSSQEAQRNAEQLREKEVEYRSIFEATDGVFIASLDGYPVEANPAICKMFGYSYEEFIGLDPTTFIHPDSLYLQDEHVQASREDNQYQSQGVVLRKDGSSFLAEAHTTPFMYKGKPHILAMVHDISERVRAEEQVREKENQYRSIFEATTDTVFIVDLEDGHVIEANPAACKVYGYSHEEFIGLPPHAIIHPDVLPNFLEKALPAIRAGGEYHTRGVNLRKDGSAFPIEVHETSFTYQGKQQMLVVIRDITEQVRAEEELREKEEQYRSIFEASVDGLLISDMEGEHLIEANPAICAMNGYTREELLALPPANLIAPEDHHLVAESLETIKQGGQFYNHSVALRKDGSTFQAESRGSTFMYKGKPHILTISRDITERIQVEEQLREKEAEYRSVFEASTDGLVINDLEDGHLVEANPAMYTMHGYTYEEFMALHPMTFIHPDSHTLFAEFLTTVKAGHQFQDRAVDIHKDGTPFPVEVHGTTFTYKGKPHVLAVVRDVTERVQAEQDLREKEVQYRSIFEATTDGLIIIDLESGRIVEANPAACKIYGYEYDEFIGSSATVTSHPDDLPFIVENVLPMIKAGGEFRAQGIGLHKDGTTFHLDVHDTAFVYQGKPHILAAVRDITEQVQAEQALGEKEVQYRSIFEATTDGLIIADLDGSIVEANPAACKMYGYSYEEFLSLHGTDITSLNSLDLMAEALQTIKTGNKRLSSIQATGLRKDGTTFSTEGYGTPFIYKGKRHVLAVVRDITELVQANQLLEQRVEERTRELSTLLEVSHNVASTIELFPLLELILDQLQVLVRYNGASILLVDGEDLVIVYFRGIWTYPDERLLNRRYPLKEAIQAGLPLKAFVLDDAMDDTPVSRYFRAVNSDIPEIDTGAIRSWMHVPLMLKEKLIGFFQISASEPYYYTAQHVTLVQAIANQAAVAIENARLYEQAQELAALEERQRLARELHDSVSQALYGITLGTHTARALLDRDPSLVAEPLNYVLSLSEAALAEMRALIFELRPESLETEGLVTSLTKQGTALQVRHNITVSLALCNEPDVPLKIKQELHRVAQEALHNIVKHASANKAELRLSYDTTGVMLEVHDNGRGFDARGSFPGHLGLRSMHERMYRLGGKLHIESQPGIGTIIRAWLPL